MKASLPVRAAILKRETYEAPAEGRLNKIRLDFNENTSGCSPAVIRALAELTPKQLAMYPEYQAATRDLARYFGIRAGELMLANGGDEALRVFFDAFVEEGGPILICEPAFPMYRYFAEIAGARVNACRYRPDMSFPMADILAALRKKPRVLFIANPNNPTGTLLGRGELRRILQGCTNTAVVIDEAYAEFSGVSVVSLIRRYPHLFVTRTFSKAAGIAALRLGAVIARKSSLDILRRAMPPFSVNLAALAAARAAVRDRAAMRRNILQVRSVRAWLAAELGRLGVAVYPSAGNFFLANFGPRGAKLFKFLERRRILLRERSDQIGPGFVRITIGTPAEMHRLVTMIQRHWKEQMK